MTLATGLVLVATLLGGPAASTAHRYDEGRQKQQQARHAATDCRFVLYDAHTRVIFDVFAVID